MKLLVDMNLSPRWVKLLAAASIDAEHRSEIGEANASDSEIMAFAKANGCVVLTHDLDFSAILAATKGDKPSVVQSRSEDLSPDVIGRPLLDALRQRPWSWRKARCLPLIQSVPVCGSCRCCPGEASIRMERCIERTRYSQVTPKEMSVANFARTLCQSVRGTTMSRSRRKTPITGNTTCRSERQDKKIWHRRWRTHEHTALACMSPEEWDSHLGSLENEVSNVWSMGKDGRHYWPVDRQVSIADQIANSKGRSPQERSSLKKRLLHKWMGK